MGDLVDISIIIPVYNVEKFLDKCLRSIYTVLSYEKTSKEIILINDGSTDSSLEILKRYKELYPENTVLIDKKNEGLSITRNLGIKKARGKYIFFLDSDDFIDFLELEKFFIEGIEKEQDILVGNYYNYFDENNFYPRHLSKNLKNIFNFNGLEFLEIAIEEKSYIEVVWRALYRKKFITENNLFFEENLLHEDCLFSFYSYLKTNKIGYSEKIFYFYRQDNQNSIMKNKNIKNTLHTLFIVQKLLNFINEANIQNKYINRIALEYYFNIVKNEGIKDNKIFKELIKLKYNFREKRKIIKLFFLSIKAKNIGTPI